MLVIQAAKSTDDVDPAVFRRAIADALVSGSAARRGNARTSRAWARAVDAAISPVADLVGTDDEALAIGITEYALGRINKLMGRVDDSSGWFAGRIVRLEETHHAACLGSLPHPVKLARRLFKLDVDGDWDILIDSAKKYADVLGVAGLAEMQKLGDKRWAELAPAPPRGERDAPRTFHLTRMMCNLAEIHGDIDAKVQVMARDLKHPYRYVEIALTLEAAERHDEALDWAERGLYGRDDRPPHSRTDDRLDDFVLERYLDDDRADDLVDLVWRRFSDRPELETFQRLKRWTAAVPGQDSMLPRALELLREQATQRSEQPQPAVSRAQTRWGGQPAKPPYEDLIAVLVAEDDLDEAWRLANEHGCTRSCWHDLAKASEVDRPLDAATVYEREIEELIDQKQTRTYEQAVAELAAVRRLYERAGVLTQFEHVCEGVVQRHKQKTKFIGLLTNSGLWVNAD